MTKNNWNILDLYKKKDDICDAYLQGRYYLEFIKIRNKNQKRKNRIKTHTGSKTS